MKDILKLPGVKKVVGDQCQLGQEFEQDPVKKATGWLSNSNEILKHIGVRCEGRDGRCSRLKGGIHRTCNGKVAKASQVYPLELCKAILTGFRDQLRADGQLMLGVVGLQWPEEEGARQFTELCQLCPMPCAEESCPMPCSGELCHMPCSAMLCPMPRAGGQKVEHRDAITGQPLRSDMVQAARREEMAYFASKQVWAKATRQEAFARQGKGDERRGRQTAGAIGAAAGCTATRSHRFRSCLRRSSYSGATSISTGKTTARSPPRESRRRCGGEPRKLHGHHAGQAGTVPVDVAQ